jgi:hypothetical protein
MKKVSKFLSILMLLSLFSAYSIAEVSTNPWMACDFAKLNANNFSINAANIQDVKFYARNVSDDKVEVGLTDFNGFNQPLKKIKGPYSLTKNKHGVFMLAYNFDQPTNNKMNPLKVVFNSFSGGTGYFDMDPNKESLSFVLSNCIVEGFNRF